MKKLLLVLLVAALAAFLFVGCLPGVTPSDGEDDDEDEVEIEICPTLTISDSVDVAGKTYIKAGSHTITVTFAVPTEPVSLWVPAKCVEKGAPEGVPDDAYEVVLYPDADKKVYTGEFDFSGVECCELYLYVLTCETCAPCKYPFIVDGVGPYAEIEITVDDCECVGCEIVFSSATVIDPCLPDVECCDDDCSGLASWSVVLYDGDPFDECCDPDICEEPIGSCSRTGCPIYCVTDDPCLTADTYYAVITLVDEVGNETVYYAKIVLSGDGSTDDCAVLVYEGTAADAPDCVDWDTETTDTVGVCTPDIVGVL